VENRQFIWESLQALLSYIVVLKRDFSEINYFYSRKLMNTAGQTFIRAEEHLIDLAELSSTTDKKTVEILLLILVCGMVMDGHLSRKERQSLKEFQERTFHDSVILQNLDGFLKAYRQGEGLRFLDNIGCI
jgi:hypothetical protein